MPHYYHCWAASALLILGVCASLSAQATPITNAFPFAIRDNETSNTVGTGVGETFSIGVSGVVPDGTQGTTASATNDATGTFENLQNLAGGGRPGLFGVEYSYATAQSSNLLGPWTIVLQNGADQLVLSTPDRNGVPKMELVRNLAISGPPASPTVTWNLPTTGPTVSQVRYELWNDDTNQILSGQSPINLGSSAASVQLAALSPNINYAIRIIVQQSDTSGFTSTRSSNWISWNASGGAPLGNVVQLVAGSPATLSQTVDLPNDPFNIVFDYRFTTTTGALSVLIDGSPVGRLLEAPVSISSEFLRAYFEIDDSSLLGMDDLLLTFQIDGPAGSTVLLDNINFPGLLDGDFASLNNWTAGGAGSVRLTRVAEPATVLLMLSALCCLVVVRLQNRNRLGTDLLSESSCTRRT